MATGTCSVDGCERATSARGWCPTHYHKWYRANRDTPEFAREQQVKMTSAKEENKRNGCAIDTSEHSSVVLCKVQVGSSNEVRYVCPWRAVRFTRTEAFKAWQTHAMDEHEDINENMLTKMPKRQNVACR